MSARPPALSSYELLRQARAILSSGTPQADGAALRPFVFHPERGGSCTAPAAGLEGFLYAEERVSRAAGAGCLLHHLKDYGSYLDHLLAPVPWAQDARRRAQEILSAPLQEAARHGRLMDFARRYAEALRREVEAADQSRWARRARVYEIFPRAYNLAGKRAALGRPAGGGSPFFADFGAEDILDIKALGFDTIWAMGVFPIGRRSRSGTAGGSPYSILDHEGLNPELGAPEDFLGFVERAHRCGMKVIIDFVPNHTSLDSKLLMSHPEFFLRREADPARPDRPDPGYFVHADPATGRKLWVRHGGYAVFGAVEFWNDTAQLDYSREGLRREMTRIARGWVDRFGVDGFRVDMAYLDLNANFSRAWGVRMPPREFMDDLIASVRAESPATAFVAESYDNWDELSAAGFDLIYGKNDIARPGGHAGWYDSLRSRDPLRLRAAMARAEFLRWQKGGADMLGFIGNHDEEAPARAFGPWLRGASLLTLLLPGAQLFYGSQETGFDRPEPREQKSLPFGAPVAVDWENADPATSEFYRGIFRAARDLRAFPELKALKAPGGQAWVGYALLAPGGRGEPGALVLANPTARSAAVDFQDQDSGAGCVGILPPFGCALLQPQPARGPKDPDAEWAFGPIL